jgi:hypothetical protein
MLLLPGAILVSHPGVHGQGFRDACEVDSTYVLVAAVMTPSALVHMQGLEEGCSLTCPTSCQAAVDSYLQQYSKDTGYQLEAPAKQKLLASCTRRCNRECVKGGSTYDFVTAFRRY